MTKSVVQGLEGKQGVTPYGITYGTGPGRIVLNRDATSDNVTMVAAVNPENAGLAAWSVRLYSSHYRSASLKW